MYLKFFNKISTLTALVIVLLFSYSIFFVYEIFISITQTDKIFIFLYANISIACIYLIASLFWSQFKFDFKLPDILLVILIVYIFFNRYLLQVEGGFTFRFNEFSGLVLLYIIIRQMKMKYLPWFFLALTIGGLLQAVYGNLQLYGYFPSLHDDFKMTGSFFNPGPFAGYLASVFPIALGIWLFQNKLFPREKRANFEQQTNIPFKRRFFICISLISGAAILLVLPASQSRAAIMAVVVSSMYLIFHHYNKNSFLLKFLDTSLKKVVVLGIIGMISLGGLGAGYWMKKDSADGRLLIWKVTNQMIQDKPIIGLGFDRFRAGYMDAQAAYFQNSPNDPAAVLAGDNRYAFNEFLQFIAEQGVIGFVLLLLLGILIVRTSSKANSRWLTISKAGILSIVVFSLFSYPAQILQIKLNFILFLAVIASFGKPISLQLYFFPESLKPWLKFSILLLVLFGSVQGGLYLNDLQDASRKWKLGLDLYNGGNIKLAVRAYDEVYPVFDREGDFLMNYGKALSMAGEHQKAVQVLSEAKKHVNNSIIQTALGDSYKAMERYSEAEDAYLWAFWMVPDRFYPKYLLAKLYEETGAWEKASLIARELIEKEPKVESTAVNEIKEEMERILVLYENEFGEPVGFSTNDSEGFENLPFEINKRVVISVVIIIIGGLFLTVPHETNAEIPACRMFKLVIKL